MEEDEDEEADDDPFYELYNCNKLTYLEKRVKSPLYNFRPIDFNRPDIETEVKEQFGILDYQV